ncbi:MAG: hypothetical protein WCR42_11965 [bacterium]
MKLSKTFRNLLYVTFGLILLSACGQSFDEKAQAIKDITNKTTKTIDDVSNKANATIKDISNKANEAISGVPYTVLSEKTDIRPKSNTNKCILLIEIKEKITVDKLTLLAKELRSTRTSYTKLWIFYYLPGMKTNAGAWATTNFDPELVVKIF